MSHILSLRGIGQPIAYFPKLSIYLGCINAGVFLGQMVFWSDKTDNPLGVYKTSEEITKETGLSYKQQVSARKKLVSLGLISETYKRLDHRLYFKFNTERFDEWFSEMLLANEQNGISPNDEMEFPELPKGHFGEIPNVSSGTNKKVVREQPKGHFVIQEITTENTTKNTSDIQTHIGGLEFQNLEWQPDLNLLLNVIRTSGIGANAQSVINMPDYQFHLGNFNAHWENKTDLTENQRTRKFAQWLILEFKKIKPSGQQKSASKTTSVVNRNVNDAWPEIPEYAPASDIDTGDML